jgi:hypothetical protein
MDTAQFTETYLLFVVLPLWLAAGIVDWFCHRAAHIELNAGPRESLIHLLMLAEAAVPLLLALFFEISGLVLLVMIAGWLLHEVTSYWDVRYATAHRRVSAFEQRVHDYLGVVPFLALSLVFVLHWPQALALVGLGPEPMSWAVAWKRPPLPVGYVAGLLGAVAVFEVLPYLEELWRGLRARERRQPERIN